METTLSIFDAIIVIAFSFAIAAMFVYGGF